MKKTALLIAAIAVFLSQLPAYAATSLMGGISVANNPLRINSGKSSVVSYSVYKKSYVRINVLRLEKPVKTIVASRLQGAGSYSSKWDGTDFYGRKVSPGTYAFNITATNPENGSKFRTRRKVTVVPKLLFSDYFTRPDGLLADNYGNNDPQGKWDVTSQRLYVKSNQGYTDSPIFRAVTNKSDFTNFTLRASMMKKTLGSDAWDGVNLFFRYKDYDNLYVAGLRNDNQLQLKKKVAGVYYTLAMVPVNSTELNRYYKLKVVANGSNIQVFVDGVKKVDINDPSFTSGKVGMRTDTIQAYFDNFEVYSL